MHLASLEHGCGSSGARVAWARVAIRTRAGVQRAAPIPGGDDEPDPGPSVLRDCADAEAYVASVCFKHGPPQRVGVELEWLLRNGTDTITPPSLAAIGAALGPHTPRSLDPASPQDPLPDGSTVTVEPGGQIELASPPLPDLPSLLQATRSDADVLHAMLATTDLHPLGRAADPRRPPRRLLDLPRYRAMERYFDRLGPAGRSGMCSTAAVQVCLDAGEGAQLAARWALVHAVGPVLLAAFANSPRLHGRHTGWKSSRWVSWQRADPARTAPPLRTGGDPAGEWARRVLDTPLLCVRQDDTWLVPERLTFGDWIRGALPRPPTTADLDYHVSTLFPPVRAHGHLEVRYVDAQPGRRWALPLAVLHALVATPAAVDTARAAAEPARDRWASAARHGLDDKVLARAALALFELARDTLPGLGAPPWLLAELDDMTERQVRRGRCPADDPDAATTPEAHR